MSDAATVCKCGAFAHTTDPTRCSSGHLLLHNEEARTHGVRAYQERGEASLPADLRQTVEAFRGQVIADRGGVDNLTAIQAGYIRRLGELETVARLLAADLAQRGLFTQKARVRNTYMRWLETLDRWDRFAQRVGTERRAKSVSLADYLAGTEADQ